MIAPVIFLLGPLALLLLASRPSTRREWFWLALAVVGVAASVQGHPGLFDQSVRAYGAFFAGAFVVTALLGIRSLVTRSLLSVCVAVGGVAAWYFKLQLRLVDLRSAFITQSWEAYRVARPELPTMPPTSGIDFVGSASTSDFARTLADGLNAMGALLPGFMTLLLLVGAWLTWNWYAGIARRPIGPPPKPFHEFSFNDQLIWALLVVTGASLLLPDLSPGAGAAANIFVVLWGLYTARGLAVSQVVLRKASPWFVLVLYLLAFPILPFALFAIGVADTWLDLRSRMAPPQGAMP